MALAASAASVPVAFPAAVPGRVARYRRLCYVILCLTGVLLPQYQDKVFAYSQPAFFGKIALTPVARDQRCRATSAGRCNDDGDGWLGSLLATRHGLAPP